MLPLQQESHELCRRDGLDLLAQDSDRQAMDTGQQTAVAPFRRIGA
jgi:hypothetical protein